MTRVFIENETGNIILTSKENDHHLADNLEFKNKCLMIKFVKEGDRYFIDTDGLNGLIGYIQYIEGNK